MSLQASDIPLRLSPEELEFLRVRVQHELIGRLSDFRLYLVGHGLVLTGRASTYHGKQLAQHAVMRSSDLPILDNRIEVISM